MPVLCIHAIHPWLSASSVNSTIIVNLRSTRMDNPCILKYFFYKHCAIKTCSHWMVDSMLFCIKKKIMSKLSATNKC